VYSLLGAEGVAAAQKALPKKTVKFGGVTLHLFHQPKSRFWWVGWHHNSIYHRASTATEDEQEAERKAIAWWATKNEELSGKPRRAKSRKRQFAIVAEQLIKQYELDAERNQRSKSYVDTVAAALRGRLAPMIGKRDIATIDTHAWAEVRERLQANGKVLKPSSLHHYENAIQLVLKYAVEHKLINQRPKFEKPRQKHDLTPRAYFTYKEYLHLCKAANANKKRLEKTRWRNDACELHDYIVFMTNSGLRIGEAKNLRFKDITVAEEIYRGNKRPLLLIRNLKGKRGGGICRTWYGAYTPFMRTVERRGLQDNWQTSSELVFEAHHRDMFRELLDRIHLRTTNDGGKRDLMSLRHTYISYRILDGISPWDISLNCRTSVEMIQKHYASRLTALVSNAVNQGRKASAVYVEKLDKKNEKTEPETPQNMKVEHGSTDMTKGRTF